MKQKLENEFLCITIDSYGAELLSIYDKEREREDLWQAEAPFWNRRSPLLFPNVGRHHDNVYRMDGKMYHTSQHGFARDKEFVCIDSSPYSLTYRIQEDEETRVNFPYDFELYITYILEGRKLTVKWKVVNPNQKTMYFTIGGHPGFYVPSLPETKQTDYFLLFSAGPELKYKLVYGESGTADRDKEYILPLEKYGEYYRCPITEHMFDRDALIFDHEAFEKVGIGYPDGSVYVLMDCKGFTNFGIWTMPGAPYICLEPWMGRCDDYGFQGDISEKPDIIALKSGQVFEKEYSMTMN